MPSLVIRRFADRLATVADHSPDATTLATAAGELLEPVLSFDHVLETAEREPHPDRYRQHILHVDPHGRFSLVALVWLPGHSTPVHDHLAWCVTGVLTGRELEQRFGIMTDSTERTLLHETGTLVNDTGDISVLTHGPDIHQVSCASDQPTISLHIYGADITRNGTSINLIYDDIPSEAGHTVHKGLKPTMSGHTGRTVRSRYAASTRSHSAARSSYERTRSA